MPQSIRSRATPEQSLDIHIVPRHSPDQRQLYTPQPHGGNTLFRSSFPWFPSRLLLCMYGGQGGGRGCHRSIVCPFLSTVHQQSAMSQQRQPSSSSQSTGTGIMGLHTVSRESTDHKHGPHCSTTLDPDKSLEVSQNPNINTASGDTHINMAPSDSMTHKHQHGFGMPHRPCMDFCMALDGTHTVITQAMDINPDPSCSRTVDTDMALGGSPGLYLTVASGDNAGHSCQYALHPPLPWWQHNYGHSFRLQHRPQKSAWPEK